ncbi:MAG: bifunctional metallophosphatase/5'-nucleotidase [Chloroflexi bacterium]|nr:bifunctional metallophosphatase/5'-nucleotidase [Chloroflexota bacterium]
MDHRKSRFAVASLLVISLLVFVSSFAASGPKTSVNVQILAVNDFHGALETTKSTGGAEYLATYVKNLEATNPNTIFVSGGDLIGASPLLSGLFHDEPTIEAFNLMGLDFATTGNHEFDEGVAELQRMQEGGCNPVDGCQDGDPFYGAEFKYLASNVIRTKNGHTLFSAYKVRSFAGVKVAFIGVALTSTPGIVTAAGTAGVEFEDEADVINATVSELKQDGIKAFVVIVHDGANVCRNPDGDNVVNATDPEIDVFIMGHSHSQYACVVNGRTISQAGSSGAYLTDVDLTLDRETGQVTAESVVNIPVVKADVAPDPEMTALLAKYKTSADPIANRVIGTITADITRGGIESALGDVIADAQLAATSAPENGGALVAFMNPGGIRADLTYAPSGSEAPGEVTYGEAFTVQPFSNNMVVMTMSGDVLKLLLEQQWGGGCARLQISNGFTYTVSQSAPVGARVSEIKINGVAIDPAANYRIATNNFLSDGGDGCTVFTQGTEKIAGVIDLDALVAYFAVNSPVAPGPQNRISILP